MLVTFLTCFALYAYMRLWICALLLFIMACAQETIPETATAPKPAPGPVETGPEPAPLVPKLSRVQVPEQVVVLADDCVKFGCPRGAEIVADTSSGLFYECNCSRAKWIYPENLLCFADSGDAMESGYRSAQSC